MKNLPIGGTLVVALSEDPGHFNPGITTGFNVHCRDRFNF